MVDGEREREGGRKGRARMGKGWVHAWVWVYVSAARIQFFRDKRIAETGETGPVHCGRKEGRKEGWERGGASRSRKIPFVQIGWPRFD